VLLSTVCPRLGVAQSPASLGQPSGLTLAEGQAAARQASPDLRAAREAVAAARARERQANALLNPTLSYGREQTSRSGQSNAQDIAQLEQPLEIRGQRRARRETARLRGEVADARLTAAERLLDYDVARAYATIAAAARRAALADEAATAFIEAGRVTTQRLAAGDVSGYAARRLQLEAVRYAAQRADAMLALRAARIELATVVGVAPDSMTPPPVTVLGIATTEPLPPLDSLRVSALVSRPELRALTLEAAATAAEARLAAAERIPTPTLSAGYKRESVNPGGSGTTMGLHGFVAGFSLPLPVFDRRRASIEAAGADTRRREAETDALRRRVRLEVEAAYAALGAVDAQLELLRPQLGENARLALRAGQAAYAEGEITLVEWLDAVRAYQEAESTFATLQADAMIRRAALERAVGIPLFARPPR
jgi:cobalt-zinc-cadmium efflux system outer membrane protein